ncbi:MAG: hypothetical protein KatS3mg110_2195 [Pirellulaceae bacterium]|nr:MAG: hypothetical protein KatS3mg110_2195 [Pirellulaceae bacterium]
MQMRIWVVLGTWVALGWWNTAAVGLPRCGAQEASAPGDTSQQATGQQDTQQPTSNENQAKSFDQLLADWKALLKEMRDLRTRYVNASTDERPAMEQQWAALIAKGNQMIPELHRSALDAYRQAPDQDTQLTRFLFGLVEDYLQRDRYEEAWSICEAWLQQPPADLKYATLAGRAAFCLNRFDEAERLLQQAQQAGTLDDQGAEFLSLVPEQKTLWAEELKLREEEDRLRAMNDPNRLPEVKLTTSKGEIVLLLFEDQAPETVANFISLVEQGFYDGLTFHRVLPGFMAQGGCPKGDGTGGPGYQIYDEFDKPGARMHFRGSLSMAKNSAPNSGGSQFFITFRPTPHLNGKHTVFGRVIDGWPVLAELQRRNPDDPNPPEPDKILKAEVLFKRNHDYQPRKVEQ